MVIIIKTLDQKVVSVSRENIWLGMVERKEAENIKFSNATVDSQ